MTQTVSTEIITSMQWQNVTRSSGCSVITYYKLRNTLKTQYRTHYKKKSSPSSIVNCTWMHHYHHHYCIWTNHHRHHHLVSLSLVNIQLQLLYFNINCYYLLQITKHAKTQCTTHYNLVITVINRQLYKNASLSSALLYMNQSHHHHNLVSLSLINIQLQLLYFNINCYYLLQITKHAKNTMHNTLQFSHHRHQSSTVQECIIIITNCIWTNHHHHHHHLDSLSLIIIIININIVVSMSVWWHCKRQRYDAALCSRLLYSPQCQFEGIASVSITTLQ